MEPRITTFKQNKKWYVNIYFPDTQYRARHSLGVPTDQNPDKALKVFTDEALPHFIAKNNTKRNEQKNQPSPNHNDPQLSEIFDWYIKTYLPLRDLSQKTINKYKQVLRDLELYTRTHHIGRISQLSTRQLQNWLIWMDENRNNKSNPRTATTRYKDLQIVKSCLTAAHETKLIHQNPLTKIPIQKPRITTDRYKAYDMKTLQQLITITRQYDPKIAPITEWLCCTGWRPADPILLTWSQIDPIKKCITFRDQKTNAPHLLPITPQMQNILDQQPTPETPSENVFPLPGPDLRKKREYLTKHLGRISQRHLGFRIRPRDIRKSYGTLLATGEYTHNGTPCPPNILQKLMLHTDLHTTLKYYVSITQDDLTRWSTTFTSNLPQAPTENPVTPDTPPKKPKKKQ